MNFNFILRVRRKWLGLILPVVLLSGSTARAQHDVSFGVLGLFHPKELILEQGNGQVLSVATTEGLKTIRLTLNGEPGHRALVLRAQGDRVAAGTHLAASWAVSARDGGAVALRLIAPGKIRRVYLGRLNLSAQNGELVAAAAMDCETAVASIVAAEMNEATPIEALKAQAVATRSFLAAGGRHQHFDFCDTTHCQFLKSPPAAKSRVMSAVEATRGLVIEYQDKPLGAMYSSRCGGRTRSLRDVGMDPGEGYPYYSVQCGWCQRHPLVWHGRIESKGPAPEASDERRRVATARQWGWSAIPGSDFTATEVGSGWQLEGHSIGHSVGMCQFGAIGMAAAGADFRQILAHYYPNTSLALKP